MTEESKGPHVIQNTCPPGTCPAVVVEPPPHHPLVLAPVEQALVLAPVEQVEHQNGKRMSGALTRLLSKDNLRRFRLPIKRGLLSSNTLTLRDLSAPYLCKFGNVLKVSL